MEIPSKLYKNLESKYLKNFETDGQVRVRLISKFRDPSLGYVSDDQEGLRGMRLKPAETIEGKSEKFFPPDSNVKINGGFIRADPGSNVEFQTALPDVYIFCVSEEVMPEFGDANYQITNPQGFGDALAQALKNRGKSVVNWHLDKVTYGGAKDEIENQDQFSKISKELANEFTTCDYIKNPSSYQHEEEWRYVFKLENVEENENTLDIEDKNLLNFCVV